MLNKQNNSFKQFIKGNGFYVLAGVALIAVMVMAIVLPKEGDGNTAEQSEQYEKNQLAAEDISELRVPTVEPRMDIEDELPVTQDVISDDVIDEVISEEDAQDPDPIIEIEETITQESISQEDELEEVVSETFSTTTAEDQDLFHGDEDLFAWPVEEQIIYEYSDNDAGNSFMNPTLDRTMRSFGLFLKAEEEALVQAAEQGKVLAVTNYPTEEISRELDYPQVGTAVVIDHGNDWKTVYGLHTGEARVEVGDVVDVGDIVGTVGKPSIDFSLTGPNLYFQVLKNDLPVNPKDLLK